MHSLCSLRSPQRSLARASLQSPRLLCSVRSHASPCHTPSVLPASLALGLACRLELPTVTASPAARATFARALPAACACCWRCAACLLLSLPSATCSPAARCARGLPAARSRSPPRALLLLSLRWPLRLRLLASLVALRLRLLALLAAHLLVLLRLARFAACSSISE